MMDEKANLISPLSHLDKATDHFTNILTISL